MNNRPPIYALAYIMRVTVTAAEFQMGFDR